MGYSVTDSGIEISRGRGKAKVTLDVSFKELERWAKKQRLDTPKLIKRSFGRAASGLRKVFVSVMRNSGGVYGMPKFKDFEAFTLDLRRTYGRTATMGGALAEPANIVAFKRNGWQVIGWPDRLQDWSAKFQEGIGGDFSESKFTDPKWRRQLHRDGIKDVPRAYVHNPRMILPEPFGEVIRKNLYKWARGAFYKDLANQMFKAGALNV